MPGHRLAQSAYALQHVVEHFGNLLFGVKEHHLTHTYRVVLHFCEVENIDYLVLRYRNTGALPFDEYSEERLFDGEVYFSSDEATDFGISLDWLLFQQRCKRLSLRIKRGEKAFFFR